MSWQHRDPALARPEAGDVVTLASDGERDAAVQMLNEAFAEGRLTADEHGDRARAARRHALTAVGPPSSGWGGAAVGAGAEWHAEDR